MIKKENSKKKIVGLGDKRTAFFVKVGDLVDEFIYAIDVDADYQREEVWSRKNQERLLDSILKGIDIPKLYLFELDKNKEEQFTYECIDGKQRILTLFHFVNPGSDTEENELLKVEISGRKYTYEELKHQFPNETKKFRDYKLEFVVYKESDNFSEDFIREIFLRLQLGIRLNSGELLNAHTGPIRDYIFRDKKKVFPFLSKTNLSDARYSRQFTLAQICINSFFRARTGEFTRARLVDLEEFFDSDIPDLEANLKRIGKVLQLMDEGFGSHAENISSRAVAVSAYLFVEKLCLDEEENKIADFARFYTKLLSEIKDNLALINDLEAPSNKIVIDEFQRYITQASVEPYSLRGRDAYLKKAFKHYLSAATKGKILGSK